MGSLKFEDAIREDPDNLELRLIAADWFEEQGDPRAEFIRLQLALENLPRQHEWRLGFSEREKELLGEHRKQWDQTARQLIQSSLSDATIGKNDGLIRKWKYRRGFIEELKVDADYLLKHFETLSRIGPICTLNLYNATIEQLLQMFRLPAFARITGIKLRALGLRDSMFDQLLDVLNLSSLRLLVLTENDLTDASAERLERLELPVMERLVIDHNHITSAGFSMLHRKFGGCIQHENGDPVRGWRELLNSDDDEEMDTNAEQYDDEALYQNGRKEKEFEPGSVDRFNGGTGFSDDLPWERPAAYAGFEREEAIYQEDRTELDETDEDPERDPDFHEGDADYEWDE